MRYLFFLFFLTLGILAHAQFADSFSDGELDNNPAWTYNSSDFEVLNGKLHSKNSMGGSVVYGISSVYNFQSNNIFKFDIELLANPSSTNYIDVFIGSDSLVEKAKNGYFIRFGDLKDEISFYKLVNGVKTELISGTDGELNKSANFYNIVLKRDTGNKWELLYRVAGSGAFSAQGNKVDSTFKTGNYTGVKIVQNGTTIIGKHSLDNFFYSTALPDTTGPVMQRANFIAPNKLEIFFDEALSFVSPSQFALNNSTNPVTSAINGSDPSKVDVSFASNLIYNNKYFITNSGSADILGNKSLFHSIEFIAFYLDTPQANDIIITEIMANPAPSAGVLPELEYVEIKNTTSKFLSLKGCKFHDASSAVVLPDSILPPYGYAIICKNTSVQLRSAGVAWIGTSTFPSLNNDADDLGLTNPLGNYIHSVSYSENWHDNGLKKNGGWSLELMDTTVYCLGKENWRSNNSNGGTPGRMNSVAARLSKIPDFMIFRSYCPTQNSIRLFFNLNPDSSTITPSLFILPSQLGSITRIYDFNYAQHSFDIEFQNSMLPDNVYTLKINQLFSCLSNKLTSQTIPFGLAKMDVSTGDIRINELLFDPIESDPDFVELTNTSNKTIDLMGLQIFNYNSSGVPDKVVSITNDGFCFFPGAYVVLTTDIESIAKRYPSNDIKSFIQISTLPTYPNDHGHCGIANSNGTIIDDFEYDEKYHSPVISNREGISLEKTNPLASANNSQFWTSASQASGFATPGLRNSQYAVSTPTQYFTLHEKWFSPDDDGVKDLLVINYNLESPGYFLSADIFDEQGGKIFSFLNNYLLDQSGTLQWDGNIGGQLIPPGNYVIFLDAFNIEGKKSREKLTFSVLK